MKLKAAKSPFPAKVKDEAVTTWVKPSLVAEVKFTEWTTKGEMRHPVYLGLRSDNALKTLPASARSPVTTRRRHRLQSSDARSASGSVGRGRA